MFFFTTIENSITITKEVAKTANACPSNYLAISSGCFSRCVSVVSRAFGTDSNIKDYQGLGAVNLMDVTSQILF
ncbi:hypothetical protein [Polaribacter sp. IC073]|uniref:hypothetical protein n=1 Tax=Polaribacter sp. IC073 TaxID=2508540 RepID=UPI0011BFA7AA|nr:hypothetical protein [Polaribacter sp. IC073]TXD47244.1 hypothetical protein ES045_11630 [Polaribacter sp. IC073]